MGQCQSPEPGAVTFQGPRTHQPLRSEARGTTRVLLSSHTATTTLAHPPIQASQGIVSSLWQNISASTLGRTGAKGEMVRGVKGQ